LRRRRGKSRENKWNTVVLQMRRAAVSIPANIAEGFKKHGQRDRMNFYNITQGSLEELRILYDFLKRPELHTKRRGHNPHIKEVGKMLYSLRASIEGI
jgi:four helix bundle protein